MHMETYCNVKILFLLSDRNNILTHILHTHRFPKKHLSNFLLFMYRSWLCLLEECGFIKNEKSKNPPSNC